MPSATALKFGSRSVEQRDDPMSLLEIQDLRTEIQLRSRVVKPVDGVTLSVEPGETLGVVGESGSGKTMVANSIMRLLPHGGSIVGGSVRLDGKELTSTSDEEIRAIRGNEIGMIFQDPLTSLNPTMNIGRQIAETVVLHKRVSKEEALERAAEVLGLVGMPNPSERLHDYPHQLSGGLRQRVMIAMALACEPKLLIADEPTTALDVTIQAQILTLLRDLKDRLGMAMLLITHDMGVIAGHADRVNVMYAGRVSETADAAELFESMHHPYTQALLASIPTLAQDSRTALHAIPGLPPDLSHPPAGCRFAARCTGADDKCRAEEPMLTGPTDHLFACWHPVSGPLQLALIGTAGPSAADTRLGAGVAETEAGGVELVEDVPVAGAESAFAADEAADEPAEEAPADGVPVVTATDRPAGRHSGSSKNKPGVPLLELRDLVGGYPVTAGAGLQRRGGGGKAGSGVSLAVPAGKTLGLVGESGCGKTTIGKMIVGLERPDGGAVLLDGVDVSGMRGGGLGRGRGGVRLGFT